MLNGSKYTLHATKYKRRISFYLWNIHEKMAACSLHFGRFSPVLCEIQLKKCAIFVNNWTGVWFCRNTVPLITPTSSPLLCWTSGPPVGNWAIKWKMNILFLPIRKVFESPESPNPTSRFSVVFAQITDAVLGKAKKSSQFLRESVLNTACRRATSKIGSLTWVWPLPAAITLSNSLISSQFCGSLAGWMNSVNRIRCGNLISPMLC